MNKNYTGLVKKSSEVLKSWQNRGLSLIGKVQVVNTLVASLFVHKMMVLPTIPDNIVKSIENLIRDYIWKGKKSKIAYPILQIPKKHGGLNLVNLKNRDIALKATWPQILYGEREYATMVYECMRCSSIQEDIWRCHIHPDDVKKVKGMSTFWKDVLWSWAQYNYYNNYREENQIIWYNSSIKIKGKIVMWKDMYSNGLIFVHQLFQNKEYKTYEQVKNEFGLTILRYNSLKAAIPKSLKDYFIQNHRSVYSPIPPHNYDLCVLVFRQGWSRKVYSFLSQDVMLIHNKYIKWRVDLNEHLCDGILEFGRLHTLVYKVTNVPKLRSFQYRLLQRALVTNVHLAKWGIIPTSLCTFCKQDEENIIHLFIECPLVCQLWQKVYQYIVMRFSISRERLNCSMVNILTNQIYQPVNSVVNFICLITKQFIYSQRCLKGPIDFPVLKQRILHVECVEKYIAIKNGKLNVHNKKWGTSSHLDNSSLNQYVTQYL